MCDYCETACDRNDSGREFGKLFDKSLDYTGEIQLSWIKENEMKTGYELYMNDDTVCTDLSVPVDFCPKCGRNLNMKMGGESRMTEKQIRDEAMRRVMWEVGHTNNDVTRYISDAVSEKIVADEGKEKFEELQTPVWGCSGM